MKTRFKRRANEDGKTAYNIMSPGFCGIVRWFTATREWAVLHYGGNKNGRIDLFDTLSEAKDEALKTYG